MDFIEIAILRLAPFIFLKNASEDLFSISFFLNVYERKCSNSLFFQLTIANL